MAYVKQLGTCIVCFNFHFVFVLPTVILTLCHRYVSIKNLLLTWTGSDAMVLASTMK